MHWTTHKYMSEGPKRLSTSCVAVGTSIFMFGCSDNTYQDVNDSMNVHVCDTVKLSIWKLKQDDEYQKNAPRCWFNHIIVANGSQIYLWGGQILDDNTDIIFCFNTEILKWSPLQVYGDLPIMRFGISACIINNCMYVFGGKENYDSYFSQRVYMLNFKTLMWSLINTTGIAPLCRYYHTASAIGNKMYIFGGRCNINYAGIKYCNDIFHLDTSTMTWIKSKVSGFKPPGRESHSAFVHNGYLYILGGFDLFKPVYFTNIMQYDPKNSIWTAIQPNGISMYPYTRFFSVVVENKVFVSGISNSAIIKKLNVGDQLYHRNIYAKDFIHILDLRPSLKDICLAYTWKYIKEHKLKVNELILPQTLKNDLYASNPFADPNFICEIIQKYSSIIVID